MSYCWLKRGPEALRAEIGHSFFNCGSLKVISISTTVLKFPYNEKRSHLVQTSACGRLLAPLAVSLALRLRRAFQNVAVITEEGHHIVQVEAVANGAAIDRAARMTAANGWNAREENYCYLPVKSLNTPAQALIILHSITKIFTQKLLLSFESRKTEIVFSCKTHCNILFITSKNYF